MINQSESFNRFGDSLTQGLALILQHIRQQKAQEQLQDIVDQNTTGRTDTINVGGMPGSLSYIKGAPGAQTTTNYGNVATQAMAASAGDPEMTAQTILFLQMMGAVQKLGDPFGLKEFAAKQQIDTQNNVSQWQQTTGTIPHRLPNPDWKPAFNPATNQTEYYDVNKRAFTGVRAPESATEQQMNMPDFKPELSGKSLLSALPVGDKALISGIIEGRIDPQKSTSLRGANRERIVKLASRVDPTYDQQWINSRQGLIKDATTGRIARNATSMNTAIGHLDQMQKAAVELKNSDVQLWNRISNFGIEQAGDPRVIAFKTAADAVATELAASLKGGVGQASPTEQEIAEWRKNINEIKSPAQIEQFVNSSMNLLGSRLSALNNQVNNLPGQYNPFKNFDLISPPAKNLLYNMGFDFEKYSGKAALQSAPTPGAVNLKKKYGLE